jgi:glycosyltransferase involved in cell wall biosynthesis
MSPHTHPVPRVSVLMAVYNAAPFLSQAIASVLSQTYHDFELIVVDDFSSDDSLAILQSFSDPRMRIIKHGATLGASIARNDALAAARGEFIAILDADDVCAPERLERQVAFLDGNANVGLVGCGLYDNTDVNGTVLHRSQLPVDNTTIQRTLMKEWCFLHSSIVFRKSLQEVVGGYRGAFEPVEDHDFVLRILELCHAHNLPEALVSYRLNPKGLSVSGHRQVNDARSAAIRLAQQRRSGQIEDLAVETVRLFERKRRRNTARGLTAAFYKWRDATYAASRYYRIGCQELGKGRLVNAHRCFVQSLRTNGLFVKS